MNPIKSTSEILAFKALNRDIDQVWTIWALDMVEAGFDSENLVILAGENEPFNQFKLHDLTNKVLNELGLDYSDINQVFKKYTCYLIEKAHANESEIFEVLRILKDIYMELDYSSIYKDFYLLYFAKDDLRYSENQWYWDGATKENINQVILDYFKNWSTLNCVVADTTSA